MDTLPRISAFTLGTVQLGMQYGMANTTGQPSREEAFGILDEAVRQGVTSLDTSVDYGSSESVIGEWRQARAHRMFVASKFVVGGETPETALRREIELSRARLGDVDLFSFHRPQEMIAHAEALKDSLLRLKETGRVRWVGASVYEAAEVEEFLRHDWFDAIQVPMSILDGRIPRAGLLEELRRRGKMVFVRSVFLQGLLCMEAPPERYAFLAPHLAALGEIARAEDMSLKEMAVAYIRDLPGVTSLVLGCETARQVRENARLLRAKPLSPAGAEAIRAVAGRVPMEKVMARITGKEA